MAIINRLETVGVNSARRRQPRRQLFSSYGLILVIAKAAKRFARTASPRTVNVCLFLPTVGMLAMAAFLWLSPYRFERAQHNWLLRIHRLTGQTEIFTGDQWRQVNQSLESRYPKLAARIMTARSEGFSDWEIEREIKDDGY